MAFFNKKNVVEVFSDNDFKRNKLIINNLMIEHAIDLISKTIAKNRFEVHRSNGSTIKPKIDDVYYTLNLKPNKNENGASFWKRTISWLLRNGEALVVVINKELYLASDWEANDSILHDKRYSKVSICDSSGEELSLNLSFDNNDSIYFNLGDHKSVELLESFYFEYDKMISASFNKYLVSNSMKLLMNYPGNSPTLKMANGQVNAEEYAKLFAGKIFEGKDSINSVPQGFSIETLKMDPVKFEELAKAVKDFGDKVAVAFGIPLDTFYGTMTEKSNATNDFITFAVQYPMRVVEDAVNSFNISKENYLKGERVLYERHSMKHFDIMDIAGSLDKLTGIGYSHNNLRKILGEPLLDEEWADKHYVTKNYMDVQDESVERKVKE